MTSAALIVGCDAYDHITGLTGCVEDATEAARFLIERGLDPRDIFLHVAPLANEPVNAPAGVKALPGTRSAILLSVHELSKRSGAVMYTFLSGHGYFHAEEKGPIFLVPGFGEADLGQNFSVPQLCSYFTSFSFAKHFVVLDSCQNHPYDRTLRTDIPAGNPGRQGWVSNDHVDGLLCCAVVPGQTAALVDHRGLLTRHVLGAFAAARADTLPRAAQNAVIFDWKTGDRSLEFEALFENEIAPNVTAAAAKAPIPQNQEPTLERFGKGKKRTPFIVFDLQRKPVIDLHVDASPSQGLDNITVRLRPAARDLVLPGPWGHVPFTGVAPRDDRVIGECLPQLSWTAKPTRHDKTPSQKTSPPFVFQLSKRPPGRGVDDWNVETIAEDGSTPELSGDDFRSAGIDPDAPPVGYSLRKDGFDSAARSRESTAVVHTAARLLRENLRHSRDGIVGVFIAPPGQSLGATRPNLVIETPNDKSHVAGFLHNEPLISLEPLGGAPGQEALRCSLQEIAANPFVRLTPGSYRVRVATPWGVGLNIVDVGDEALSRVRLPMPNGRAPLRNKFAGDEYRGLVDRRYLLVDGRAADRRVSDADMDAHFDLHLFKIPTVQGLTVLVRREAHGWRAEPYCALGFPEWDMLFTAGRLGDINLATVRSRLAEMEAEMAPVESDILRLGSAYAAIAQNNPDAALGLLAGLRTQDVKRTPDVLLVQLRAINARTLTRVGVPLLSWGDALLRKLAPNSDLSARPSTSSVWAVYSTARTLAWTRTWMGELTDAANTVDQREYATFS